MASKTSKWMATVASAAMSVIMGGAAFAAPATAFEGTGTTMGLFPQVRPVTDSLRSTDADSDVISNGLGKVLSHAGTKVAEVKGQAREVLNQAS